MSIADKLKTIADNMTDVYEAKHNEFWDNYLFSNYYAYRFAGQGWTDLTFRPTKDIILGEIGNGLFRETSITNLSNCLQPYEDEQGNKQYKIKLDTSQVKNATYAFAYGKLQVIPKIDLSSVTTSTGIFQNLSKLTTIEGIVVSPTTTFVSSTFSGCTELNHLIMSGTLAKSGLDLSSSPKLDEESLASIVNVLQDRVAEGLSDTNTITLSSQSESKISDSDKARISQKGWSVIYK